MCCTCDTTTFEEIDDQTVGKTIGCGELQIQCDKKYENYYFAIKDRPNSKFRTYYCPTCGRRFF